MDFVQAATNAIALLPPLLPAILDGGAKEVGKTAVAATLDQGKKVWGLLSGAPGSGPVIVAVEAVAAKPDDAALQDALKGQIIALLATNATLLQQVAAALADESPLQARNIKIKQGSESIAVTGKFKARDVNFGKTVKKKNRKEYTQI